MKMIGVTGGVGSGKSEVMKYIAGNYDAAVLLADHAGHLLMKSGQACYEPVRRLFGDGVLDEDGELDRSRIARIVYQDHAQLEALSRIIHPAVRKYISEQIEAAAEQGKTYFFLEAALLLEEHYDEICDEVWYIYAHQSVRRERLKKSRNYSDAKITQMIANQLDEEEFKKRCDITIDNSGTFENTARQIEARMKQWRTP
ncbi:dephospho-CoA kinase [Lawsonibacter sp. OA9]|nr:dephospho-CoA kinase [Lawsonibacter sp. OA9]